MLAQLRPALLMFSWLTFLTGVLYPGLVTAVAQVAFPHQARGSLIVSDGAIVGSEWIGQPFEREDSFWSRPSATGPAYNAGASSGSNLGPTNPDYLKAIEERVANLKAAHPDQGGPVPTDLVTASASGLDPHLSPAAANYQVGRVARARNLSEDQVRQLVARFTEGRTFGILGEPRVNVLRLNLALKEEGRQRSAP